jgi:NADH-quinone oxidoreductase subunit C
MSLSHLKSQIESQCTGRLIEISEALGELTLVVKAQDYFEVCNSLREGEGLKFDTLIDLCGMDYSEYKNTGTEGPRFAVVVHLLSVEHNHRVRVRVYCLNDDLPEVPSIKSLWSAADWFEREAFDLFGIVFDGHDDLRRILTDYGFVGHPFRKDFPITGYVEMRYDPEQRRVIYQPVTIEPRDQTPRVVREDTYGGFIPQ